MVQVLCPQDQPKVLVFCQKCRNPIGRLAPGSDAELRCHRCGVKTNFEVKAA